MKNIAITLLLLLTITAALSSQTLTLSGSVLDTAAQPIPYATVSLLRPDSTLVIGTITDDNGNWSLTPPKGTYILKTSFIGYTTDTQPITLTKDLNSLKITLKEESTALDEIEVTAKRPSIERHADKLVLNVSESTFAIGSNATEILQKSPGVNIDKDGNVTVNGKSVEVYINGKQSYMSGEQLKGLLQGTDGASIDRIEIITNPGSKYDAAGQGGIIDIKLKRSLTSGLSGTVSGSYGGMYYGGEINKYVQRDNVSLSLNYSGKNTYTSLMLSQAYGDYGNVMDGKTTTLYGDPVQELCQNSHNIARGPNYQYYMFRLSNDWMIDSKNTFGFILQVPISLYGVNNEPSTSETTLNGDIIEQQESWHSSNSYSPQHTANLNYTHTFVDSLNQELTINADYSRYNSKDNTTNNTHYIYGIPAGLSDNLNIAINTHSIVDIYSAKVDFQTAFWQTGMIECGLKWSMANTNNTMLTDSTSGDYHSQTPQDFKYSEQVAAAYITAAKQFDKHWSAKLGLRGELTYAKGDWTSADTTTGGKPYFDLFPTAYLAYSPTDDWMLSASYSRRISRPSYSDLAPFVSYQNAHTIYVGNPDLKPMYGDNAGFNLSYSQYASLSYDFSQVRDMRAEVLYVQPNGDMLLRPENFGKYTNHSITLALTEIPIVYIKKTNTTWLTLTANAQAGYQINESGEFVNKLWSGQIYGVLTLHLPLDFKFSVDGWWHSPQAWGYVKANSQYMFNAALKKQFLKRALTLSLKVNDIFRTMNFCMEMTSADGNQSVVYNYKSTAQRISIGISYNFGKRSQHKYRRVGDVDESSRLGGSGGLSGGGN